jgi:hypothetical protein
VAAVAIDRCTGEAAFTTSGLHGLARRNALLAVVMPPNEKIAASMMFLENEMLDSAKARLGQQSMSC